MIEVKCIIANEDFILGKTYDQYRLHGQLYICDESDSSVWECIREPVNEENGFTRHSVIGENKFKALFEEV